MANFDSYLNKRLKGDVFEALGKFTPRECRRGLGLYNNEGILAWSGNLLARVRVDVSLSLENILKIFSPL